MASVPVSVIAQTLVFSIYTPAFGTTRRSDQQFAKVTQESTGVWLICFEDGNDNDFNDLIVRVWDSSCDAEAMQDSGQDPVHVKYDPRFMWNPKDLNFMVKASWMAEAIRQRALDTRAEMANVYAQFGAQSEVSGWNLDFEVSCHPTFNSAGYTQNINLIKLNAPKVQPWMEPYVAARAAGALQQDLPIAGEPWADLVDHELYHTYQIAKLGQLADFTNYNLLNDKVNIESTAQLNEDFMGDTDDTIVRTGHPDDSPTSYRDLVRVAFGAPNTTVILNNNTQDNYRAGAFFQYLGEQYGQGPTLETKVARFARDVYSGSGLRLESIAHAMGGSKTRADVIDALRDFWATELVRDSGNLGIWPNRFRLLDESTLHGGSANFSGPIAALRYPAIDPTDVTANQAPISRTLPPTATALFEVMVPVGTALMKVHIVDHSVPATIPIQSTAISLPTDPVRIALIPALAGGNSVYDPAYFAMGPALKKSETYSVIGAGMSKLYVVLTAGETQTDFDLDVTSVQGSLALTIDPPSILGNSLVIGAHPTVGSVFARQQPAAAFTVTVDGSPWSVGGKVDFGTTAFLVLPGASSLAPGNHILEVTYHVGTSTATANRTFSAPGGFAPDSTSPDLPVISITGSGQAGDPLELAVVVASDGVPLPGSSVTATVVDPIGTTRSFSLGDHGSQFDAASGDGGYGAEAFGTSLTGTYNVTFQATGSVSGVPYSTSRSQAVTVSPGVDSDGDGVSDVMEARLGLNPASSADGATDLDLDGVGTNAELAAGTNPTSSDTDEGGEADGSELANGGNPLSPADDAVLAQVGAGATAVDGRLVNVQLDFTPDNSSARVYRVSNGVATDLGLKTGDQTMSDGPLTTGTYSYRVVVESSTGRRGPVLGLGDVVARDNATSPTASLQVANGGNLTKTSTVPVAFLNVTGVPTQMRFAADQAALSAAAWVPYQTASTFQVSNVDGAHAIWAQIRDAAGNESLQLQQTVTLDLVAPTSSAGPLPSYSLSSFVNVPFVASDARGVALVQIWVRSRPTPNAQWSQWSFNIMGETSPLGIGLGNGYYEFASVAIDEAGNVEALPSVGDTAIRIGPEIVNDDVGAVFQGNAQATNGRDGSNAMVWVDNRNSASVSDIYFSRRIDASATWGVNERVDDAAVAASSPSVAIDASGNVYVAWADARRGDKDIYVAKRTQATGLWGPSVLINDDPVGAIQDSPTIDVSSTGEVIVVWADQRGSGANKAHIYSARLPAGSSAWSADIRVSSDQKQAKTVPSIAIGPTGIAYVVFQQAGNKNSVWFSSLPSGGATWSAPVQINDTNRSQGIPRITVDSAGRLLAAYQESTQVVWARTRPGGSSTWSTAVLVSTQSNAVSLAMSVRGNGVGFAAWATAQGVLWGARFDPATSTWGAPSQLSFSLVYSRPAVVMTSALAVVGSEQGTGTATDLRAAPIAVP